MKQEKQDRRSRRTRQLVQSAMMELLQEKRYEAITVRDILERSGIGSSTFYAHYFDKDDVQAAVMEQIIEQLSQPLSQNRASETLLPSLALFRHVQENSQQFQALVRGHLGEQMWEMGQKALSRIIEEALERTSAEKYVLSVPAEMVAQYLAGAFLSLLKWWIEADMPYSPEHMDEVFRKMSIPGVRSVMVI